LILEFKSGTIVMPLIEEKTGFGFSIFYPKQGCARYEKYFTPRAQ
jgi:hypothetical protein